MMFRKVPLFYCYHTKVHSTSYIMNGCNLLYCNIDKYCFINRYCNLNHVSMGNYCSIGPFVLMGGEEHSIEYVSTSNLLSDLGVSDHITEIGNDVWIGTQSCIKQGVKIGNGAVVGANSFVNKDVPPYAIVVGSPARIIKYRFPKEKINDIENSHYWDYPPSEAKKIITNLYSR